MISPDGIENASSSDLSTATSSSSSSSSSSKDRVDGEDKTSEIKSA
eukprot:CAMPEP_0176505310 /NCGR_PEP_ID=MMETSP0200_2-20121128/16424_1 /TAXON_ID=947934 /ORGANISM="Chaetoceros sp., Strain GSL56" /LENGTH=45 /DNA_ID= /DNA_START= /DNA_END= /DNA_ORIENTATION=